MTARPGWLVAAVILFTIAAAGGAWLAVATEDDEASRPSVACWDGSEASAAAECPLPVGRAGLASVFPSLGPTCVDKGSAEGKAEVFVCASPGLVVRYSRWDLGIDRIAYFQDQNPDAFLLTWRPGGVDAGVQWTSRDAVADDAQPWQWSATYSSHPYSVSVEGATKADRRHGIERVRATASQLIGLATS